MSDNKKCVRCVHSSDYTRGKNENQKTVLVCRFYPPNPVRGIQPAHWPEVKADDFCSKFKAESETE